MVWITLFKRVP